MLDSILEHKDTKSLNLLNQLESQLNDVVLGKAHEVRLCLCCLLAGGHLLIEDHPGLGKTTLAHALARVLGLEFARLQFTSDMLPADVVGVSIYDTDSRNFSFHPGPVFKSVVLADEINRASPKAQSALLEAMEERQVSVDGVTHPLPSPFFVIATQNPHDQAGTFPLPESQLDRFMMTLSLGYPERDQERTLLTGGGRRAMIETIDPLTDAAGVIELQRLAESIHLSNALADYILDLLDAGRRADWASGSLSPRAGLALASCAKAWAFIDGREAVIPEDVQQVAAAVTGHRLSQNLNPAERARAAERLLSSVNII